VKGIEVYRDRLILYGCGDFLTDYEGIRGYEAFRDDLGLMYFARVQPATGKLLSLDMTPTQIHRMRLRRANAVDTSWLETVLNREGQRLGTRVEYNVDRAFTLGWDG
jgi:poly-gamma-glutamate capsule biosynthesis protein CapA/YwtB (metallophosphatase superfamily)